MTNIFCSKEKSVKIFSSPEGLPRTRLYFSIKNVTNSLRSDWCSATTRQLAALVDISANCFQFIRVSFSFFLFKSKNWFKLLIIIWMETNVMVVSMLKFQYMTASAHLWGLVACRNRGGTIETERSTTSGLVPTQTTTNTYTCQCGIERNCVDPNVKCNCD